MRRRRAALALGVLAAACLAMGAAAAGEGPADAAPTPAGIESLAWLAGLWGGISGGQQTEEYWLPPKGKLMLGLHRDVGESGRAFFEYLRIEETPEGLVYVASPRGGAGTSFRWVEGGERRAVFANPEHDFPQRISYWLDEEGALWARAEAGEKALQWRWTRLDGR